MEDKKATRDRQKYYMDKVKQIIKKKPFLFVGISILYLVGIIIWKWNIHPTWATLLYGIGGLFGIYFLDIAEEIFAVTPSPFRTVLFLGAFALVSFFVVTSSGNALATGLVLSMFLDILFWQMGELVAVGNLNRWYTMVEAHISQSLQKWGLVVAVLIFLFETASFLRN